MTDHPLTETAAALLWNQHRDTNALPFHEQGRLYMRSQTAMLRAAFDAGREHERTTNPPADADRPWEPLSGPARVGDEVRQDRPGTTITGVVGRVDEVGDPWATGGNFIGRIDFGTWYVRRPVQELPTEDGAVIVPADGREFIEIRAGKKSRRLTWDADAFVWYDAYGTYLGTDITTGTWKVDGEDSAR